MALQPSDGQPPRSSKELILPMVLAGMGFALVAAVGQALIPFIDNFTANWIFYANLTLIEHPIAYGSLFFVLVSLFAILGYGLYERRRQERRIDAELAAQRQHEEWKLDRTQTSAERIAHIQFCEARTAEAKADVMRNVETVDVDERRAGWMDPQAFRMGQLKLVESVTKYHVWLQEEYRLKNDASLLTKMQTLDQAEALRQKALAFQSYHEDDKDAPPYFKTDDDKRMYDYYMKLYKDVLHREMLKRDEPGTPGESHRPKP